MATRRDPARSPAWRGFTLVEMLMVVTLLAIFARVMLPSLADGDQRRLEVAASEVREALRFARAEAMRRGQSVLFDAESTPGRLKLLGIGCTSSGSSKVIVDPRTKLAFNVTVTDGPFSTGVSVTPRFMAGGSPWGGVVFGADGVASDACQVTGMSSKGAPQAGSGVLLSIGARQATVTLDAATGRVTGP